MKFLLDTNVVSEIQKPLPDAQVLTWYDGLADSDVFLSVATLGEIAQGIEGLRPRDPDRAHGFDQWLVQLRHAYHGRIVDIDSDVGELWGRLNGRIVADGGKPQVVDNLIAASALNRGLTLATRNVKDFSAISIPLFDPWRQILL